MDWTPEELQAIVDEHALVLFMKGTPDQAQCGFSNRAAQVLQALGEPFAAVNILTDPRAIPSVCTWSDFPTMPQVFVHGELIGGSDIALEMLNDGSLREMYDAKRVLKFGIQILKLNVHNRTSENFHRIDSPKAPSNASFRRVLFLSPSGCGFVGSTPCPRKIADFPFSFSMS